jgi:hypothetical protein
MFRADNDTLERISVNCRLKSTGSLAKSHEMKHDVNYGKQITFVRRVYPQTICLCYVRIVHPTYSVHPTLSPGYQEQK